MGKGSRAGGVLLFLLSYYYYYYYYYYLPFLNSLRLKWQMHRPHVQQTFKCVKVWQTKKGGGGCAYIHNNYYYTPQSPKYK
jgi:hypothetical protein